MLLLAIVVTGSGVGHSVSISTKVWMETRCIVGATMLEISSPTKVGTGGMVSNVVRRRPSRRRSELAVLR